MSSNISIEKVCQHCNFVFVAKTTKTKYCSLKCSSKAYKIRVREAKVGIAKKETEKKIEAQNGSVISLDSKVFLKVSEAAKLLSCSTRTIYRLIQEGTLCANNLGERITRIKRSELDKVLLKEENERVLPVVFNKNDYYTVSELLEKYKYSKSSIYQILKRNKVEKIQKHKHVFILKEEADNLLNHI
ncbi:helix-turn-helix domain-containing protein [Bizionia gelidisalsuginis]|uniref:Helix-turn-helix domain-containing protein n=1 Tax=Bizionia gelidisalsuginis TaxID=291188 RepID=A0ABY3MEK2_9FLAO|nr:helix-turn-helix domain-containing protein [Bizionia gelidisalsuginis]TYC18034.1 helix-turn-helix domain-containing protein [Bizionia gelidisalsuginis]